MTEEVKEEKTLADTPVSAEVIVENESSEELVMSAKIKTTNKEEVKEEVKEVEYVSSTVTITNTSQNSLCLNLRTKTITIYPRQRKEVLREDVKELLENEVVRRWFDKGILTSDLEAEEQSVHEAKAPEELKGPVEKHDGVNISASVKKFVSDGSVKIEL